MGRNGGYMQKFGFTLAKLLILASTLCGSSYSASAQTFKTQPGQPLCASLEDLQSYMLAGLLNNRDAKWDCLLVEEGLRLEVEEVVRKTEIGDLVKARVFVSKGKRPARGYTMNIGLKHE